MAMIHVLLEENLFDAEFTRRWTNGPFLVRCDNNRLFTESDLLNPTEVQKNTSSGTKNATSRAPIKRVRHSLEPML